MKNLLAIRALRTLFKKSFVIHPLLFAIFPVLFLYAHNMGEVSANEVVMPMLFSALGALLLCILLSLLLRNTLKAGLAATIFVIFFFSYGRLYDLLVKWDVFVPNHAYLFPAALLVLGYCVYFIKIVRRDFRNTTKILNVVSVVLILVNLSSITLYEIGKDDHQSQPASVIGASSSESGTMPDIYYIILDEYASPSTMLEYYDYDNSPFINNLVDKGFYVASSSRDVYPATWKSIASSLNMEYIPGSEPDEVFFQKIANSTVANYLRSIGYTYVYFGSWFDEGRYKVNSDVYYNFYESSGSSAVVSEFSRMLWNTTMASPFYDYLTGSVFEEHSRSALLETIQGLKTMPDVKGPKFVYAHFECPHVPFVFGPNGEYVDPMDWYNHEDKQFYLGQYIFISNEIAGVVAEILEKSSSDPIIILQSDHGPRSWVSGLVGMDENEWQKVLNAYYLPGDGKDDLYDSISPVNSFRVIFNHYFGAYYDLLED